MLNWKTVASILFSICAFCRSYLEAIFNALECGDNDYEALFALCLLYALGHNKGKQFYGFV